MDEQPLPHNLKEDKAVDGVVMPSVINSVVVNSTKLSVSDSVDVKDIGGSDIR